jgi:hypothetical protein
VVVVRLAQLRTVVQAALGTVRRRVQRVSAVRRTRRGQLRAAMAVSARQTRVRRVRVLRRAVVVVARGAMQGLWLAMVQPGA